MTQQHLITPPPELVEQWHSNSPLDRGLTLATQAAQWGADQELLACGNYLKKCAQWEEEDVTEFYNYRRPKPPTLKEQAQAELKRLIALIPTEGAIAMAEPIRRALEALPDG